MIPSHPSPLPHPLLICLHHHQSPRSFPVAHVAFRLEQIAAALWPQTNTVARPCGDAVAVALRKACRYSLPAVQRAYEKLFSRRTGLGQADAELSATKLRAQLLRCEKGEE